MDIYPPGCVPRSLPRQDRSSRDPEERFPEGFVLVLRLRPSFWNRRIGVTIISRGSGISNKLCFLPLTRASSLKSERPAKAGGKSSSHIIPSIHLSGLRPALLGQTWTRKKLPISSHFPKILILQSSSASTGFLRSCFSSFLLAPWGCYGGKTFPQRPLGGTFGM
jgi:hypothetical protein